MDSQVRVFIIWEEWTELYKKIVFWELELENSADKGMYDILKMQKAEANAQFGKFIESNYIGWLKNNDSAPLMSHHLLRKKLFPVSFSFISLFPLLFSVLSFGAKHFFPPMLFTFLLRFFFFFFFLLFGVRSPLVVGLLLIIDRDAAKFGILRR
jgi:hypothetical protein